MPAVHDVDPPRSAAPGGPAKPAAARGGGRSALLLAARQELAEHGPARLSLRAVARRAGVSHAAPKHHFADRAGLLTALAAEGFRLLGDRFRAVADTAAPASTDLLTALGRAYLDFSVAEADLFEVMYGTEPLHAQDPDLMAQRRVVFSLLSTTVSGAAPEQPGQPVPVASLTAWAMIHGLVMLTRDGSLQRVTGTDTPEHTVDLARALTETFTETLRRAAP